QPDGDDVLADRLRAALAREAPGDRGAGTGRARSSRSLLSGRQRRGPRPGDPRRPAPRAGGGVDGRAGFGLSRARRGYGGPLRGELTSPVQDDMRDQVVQPADVDVLAEIDLDVAGPRPQFELGVEVQDSSRV